MPLVYQQNIDEHTRLAVWHITEQEDFFAPHVSLQRQISHPHKRLQHLAGRYLLKLLFPDFPLHLIAIADTRKPYIPAADFQFSISHCGDYAAAIVSTWQRVGIDIELPKAILLCLRQKFLTQAEDAMLCNFFGNTELALTLGWSAKEALFKWYGKGQVDFKKHLVLEGIGDAGNCIPCRMEKEPGVPLMVHASYMQGLVLCYVATGNS